MNAFESSTLSKPVQLIIVFYQLFNQYKHVLLHSVFGFSSVCKHRPTCSQYTLQEIRKNGTITGLRRGFFRILFCF